jgi:hypothetical protein
VADQRAAGCDGSADNSESTPDTKDMSVNSPSVDMGRVTISTSTTTAAPVISNGSAHGVSPLHAAPA